MRGLERSPGRIGRERKRHRRLREDLLEVFEEGRREVGVERAPRGDRDGRASRHEGGHGGDLDLLVAQTGGKVQADELGFAGRQASAHGRRDLGRRAARERVFDEPERTRHRARQLSAALGIRFRRHGAGPPKEARRAERRRGKPRRTLQRRGGRRHRGRVVEGPFDLRRRLGRKNGGSAAGVRDAAQLDRESPQEIRNLDDVVLREAHAAGLLANVDEPHDPAVEIEGREEHARGRPLDHQVRQLSRRVHDVEERRLAVLVNVLDDRVVAAEPLGETVRPAEAELRLQAKNRLGRVERVERRLRRSPFLAEDREKVLVVLLFNRREHGCLRIRKRIAAAILHASARRPV